MAMLNSQMVYGMINDSTKLPFLQRHPAPGSNLDDRSGVFTLGARDQNGIMGKAQEKHGKTMGKPWENGDLTKKHYDLMVCLIGFGGILC